MNFKYWTVLPLLVLSLPLITTATAYTPLVSIPGVTSGDSLDQFINAIFILSIAVAAMLAVIKLIVAGVKYMLDDIVTSKEDAKKDIWGALLGLLLIMSTVIILNTINANITQITFGGGGVPIDNTGSQTPQNNSAPDSNVNYVTCEYTTNQQNCTITKCPDGSPALGPPVNNGGNLSIPCPKTNTNNTNQNNTNNTNNQNSVPNALPGVSYTIDCNNAQCSSTSCPSNHIDNGVTMSTSATGDTVYQLNCTVPSNNSNNSPVTFNDVSCDPTDSQPVGSNTPNCSAKQTECEDSGGTYSIQASPLNNISFASCS